MARNPWARPKRQEMCDGWASFCDLADPIAAWESVYSPKRVAVYEPELGGISAIVAPFVYLADKGTAAALGSEIATLRGAATVLRRHGPGPLHEPDRLEETAKRIEAEIPRLERMQRAATMAEKLGWKYGWKYDATAGKVCEVAKHKGGDLLVRIIQRFGAEHGTDSGVREKIRKILSPIFEAALDAGPRGNIARALENMKR